MPPSNLGHSFSLFLVSLLFLCRLPLISTFPTPSNLEARDTAEVYFLTNCFNNRTYASHAEIDYYADSSFTVLGGNPTAPDEKDVINRDSSIDYEDGTWTTTKGSPFKFTAFIEEDAYTAPTNTLVGNANSSTFAGPMDCYRLTRVVVYSPRKHVDCYSDYACFDSQQD